MDHRNVVLFHFLLNGRKKGASGPLRIFESWFRPHRCTDLLIDDSGFGINAADTRVLLERLKALPNSEIRARQRLYIEMHARREGTILSPPTMPRALCFPGPSRLT